MQENNLISEKDILDLLDVRKGLYAPLAIVAIDRKVGKGQSDAKITLSFRGRKVSFLAEVKSRTAPKIISEGLWRLKNYPNRSERNLLLVVPYLSKTIQELLNEENISGIDLSGNYMIQTSEVVAVRLDQKNQFPESQPIKKIFSGNSSIVGRLFLTASKQYESVNAVNSAIKAFGGNLSLSAVSKVLSGLEDELIIEKSRGKIFLLQPEKLLQKLQDDYRPPKVTAEIRLQLPLKGLNSLQDLNKALAPSTRWVLSGESSVERYAVTTRAEISTVYATALGTWSQYENDRFYNVIMKRTLDSFPYFDARENNRLRWASPIQCYLELSKMDKREKEIAETVREAILTKLK